MLRLWLVGACLAGMLSISAQVSLKFCGEVQKDGNCTSESSKFFISKEGGTIAFLLRQNGGLNLTDVRYKIFKMDSVGNETYTTSIDQRVEKNWNFAWQDAVFYDPGNYEVKVYDAAEHEVLVCTSTVILLVD